MKTYSIFPALLLAVFLPNGAIALVSTLGALAVVLGGAIALKKINANKKAKAEKSLLNQKNNDDIIEDINFNSKDKNEDIKFNVKDKTEDIKLNSKDKSEDIKLNVKDKTEDIKFKDKNRDINFKFNFDDEDDDLSLISRYQFSHKAKVILSSEAQKNYYSELANEFLSYKDLKLRNTWHYDSVNQGRNKLAKMKMRGKTLCLYLALDPKTQDEKYHIIDSSDVKKFAETPCLMRIKNDRNLKLAKELIDIAMEKNGYVKYDAKKIDFVALNPYIDIDSLVEKGYAKEVMSKEEFEKVNHGLKKVKKVKNIMEDADEEIAYTETNGEDEMRGELKNALEKVTLKEDKIDKSNKAIVNICTVSKNFNAGEEVTIKSLKAKNLIHKKTTYIKILAKGATDKSLNVIANEFSSEAVKVITENGGKVVRIKGVK